MSCLKGLTDATIKSKMTHSLPSDGSGQLPSYRKLCTNVKYYNCTCVRPLVPGRRDCQPLKVLSPPQRHRRQRRGRSQASRSSCHPSKLGLPQFFLPLHLLHLFPRALYLTRRLMVARSRVCLAWWSQRTARLRVSPARIQTRQPVRRWNQLKREQ